MISVIPLIFEVLFLEIGVCEGCEGKFGGILLLCFWFGVYKGVILGWYSHTNLEFWVFCD